MFFLLHCHFNIDIVFNEKYVIDFREHLKFAKNAIHEEYFKRFSAWIVNDRNDSKSYRLFVSFFSNARKIQIIINFSYLIELTKNYSFNLTWIEITKKNWLKNNDNFYAWHLKKIVFFNNKFQQIQKILDILRLNYLKRSKKILFFFFFFVMCFVLVLINCASRKALMNYWYCSMIEVFSIRQKKLYSCTQTWNSETKSVKNFKIKKMKMKHCRRTSSTFWSRFTKFWTSNSRARAFFEFFWWSRIS